MPRIESSANVDLDRFVELGVGRFFHQLDAFVGLVLLQRVNLFGGRAVLLSTFRHSFLDTQSWTLTPMLRAAPSIIRMAAPISLAFRSFILVSAISRTLARRIVPAVVRPAAPLPLSIPAAFLIRSAAGGVLVTKRNERSSKIVMSAGMTMPDWVAVRSLYSFKNAIMLMPCWPSAGPTGGAGVALPAGNCRVMTALIFFATKYLREVRSQKSEIRRFARKILCQWRTP